MSKLAGKAYHPVNDSEEDVWEGFSWPCLFLGFIWYIYKGMWGWGVIALILALATWGISWLIFPFFANAQHAKYLIKQGYLSEQQWKEKNSRSKNSDISSSQSNQSIADELTKLVKLKENGVLSDEEYIQQKNKLLSQ